MKLFKDVQVGEHFVMHNGQQLIRVASETKQTHNCVDYLYHEKRFDIHDDVECLTVDELIELSESVLEFAFKLN